ncbi:HNH endonuclease signature motif containing protein [Niameybacter massiliensis]|uniref:HNH endonuclease signature motif containing protein n=1 Tax=Holtiella tumoricola TaxID=3018743 RepID=A0AA42DNC2_9FIRM|nr:HNH endonuclease signature motif containing protein [Holtiella tumoricola]
MTLAEVISICRYFSLLNIEDDIKDLNKFVEIYREEILYYIDKLVSLGDITTFCYSYISSEIIRCIDRDVHGNKSDIKDYRGYYYTYKIDNLLYMFFGEPYDKNNQLRQLWFKYVKEYMNEKFFEMDIDDRRKRDSLIHGKTRAFRLHQIGKCQICKKNIESTLRLSHIKPWYRCVTKVEKRDINNTLLLCFEHDRLFENGYISFTDDGEIIISKLFDEDQVKEYNLDRDIKIKLDENSIKYIEYHRLHSLEYNYNS